MSFLDGLLRGRDLRLGRDLDADHVDVVLAEQAVHGRGHAE